MRLKIEDGSLISGFWLNVSAKGKSFGYSKEAYKMLRYFFLLKLTKTNPLNLNSIFSTEDRLSDLHSLRFSDINKSIAGVVEP